MPASVPVPNPAHCVKKPKGDGSIPLTVLPSSKPAKPHSTMGKWRTAVLIAVHLLIIVHVTLWLTSGPPGARSTLSPVEPSETMYTLELGRVNAGFIMFAVAILSTLLLGRFFCGWACHIVALQDLCGWFMKRLGVHPKPWRSRLLLWMPLLIALYMFVWPTFRREVIAPMIGDKITLDGRTHYVLTPMQAAWIGDVRPLTGFQPHFQVREFWATFPPWYVAVPFLMICGFATVYFLGAKGFCTYGCPYGGFFTPADKLAPVRIRVTDACEHCGHCTSVCTSNVRVHEEVRDYGMVVDPGCMKCMDCISACPNDALYLGLGKPAILAKVRSAPEVHADAVAKRAGRYDLSLTQEIVLLVVFILLLNAYRGLYGLVIPMLMATGAAAVVTFFIHRTWQLVRLPSVRAPFWQLKVAGRTRPAGYIFALCTLVLALMGVHGLVLKVGEWVGSGYDGLIAVQRAVVLTPGYAPAPGDLRRAREAISWYEPLVGFKDGGISPTTRGDIVARLSWLHAVSGDLAQSERYLRATIAAFGMSADPAVDLATFRVLRGGTLSEARADLAAARKDLTTEAAPLGSSVMLYLTGATLGPAKADPVEALAVISEVWPESPAPPLGAVLVLGNQVAQLDRGPVRALALLRAALARWPIMEDVRFVLAQDLLRQQKPDEALALYRLALQRYPGEVLIAHNASDLMLVTNHADEAAPMLATALKLSPAAALLWDDYATAMFYLDRLEEAEDALHRSIKLEPSAERWLKLADLYGPTRLNRPADAAKAQGEADQLVKSIPPAMSTPRPDQPR